MATGNSASTIFNLKIKYIDFESGFIKLPKTKNRKQQLIPFSKTLSKILSKYLKYGQGVEDDCLFSI